MRNRFALLAAVAGLLAAPTLNASAATTSSVRNVKVCSVGYVHANLPWGEKCLRAGGFCKAGNRSYLRFGFYCPATGHLRRR